MDLLINILKFKYYQNLNIKEDINNESNQIIILNNPKV